MKKHIGVFVLGIFLLLGSYTFRSFDADSSLPVYKPAPPGVPVEHKRPVPPNVVYVRGESWDIFYGDTETDIKGVTVNMYLKKLHYLGYTDCLDQEIFVSTNQPINSERDTVYHELLHAGTCVGSHSDNAYYNSPSGGEHPGIERISSYTIDLFRENPELESYIMDY